MAAYGFPAALPFRTPVFLIFTSGNLRVKTLMKNTGKSKEEVLAMLGKTQQDYINALHIFSSCVSNHDDICYTFCKRLTQDTGEL